MSTDIKCPTCMLHLAANIIDEIGAEVRRKGWGAGWGQDPENPDLPASVTWREDYPILRTVIEYSGHSGDWSCDVEQAVREVLRKHDQSIVQSSFHETENTFLKVLESDYVKVVIENEL